jgi:putative IMPACT (imprinted ancient) family translation regulator
MLDVLEGEEIVNICVVVTRYFGGTLLGTGGLVRAYSGAVKEGLKSCTVLTLIPARKLLIDTDYNGVGKIQYLLGQRNLVTLNSEYTDRVMLTVLVPDEEVVKLQADITEATGGKAVLEISDSIYYGMNEKEVLLFPEG